MTDITWSYSRLKAFQTCPRQFHHVRILKDVTEAETQEQLFGTALHLAAEEYVRDNKPLPPRFRYLKAALDVLKQCEGAVYCEYPMGLTQNLEPCAIDSDDVWFRGIADFLVVSPETKTARCVDYKSGKRADRADPGQLELMALAIFRHFPEVETVYGGLLFTQVRKFIKRVYSVENAPELWAKWIQEYRALRTAHRNDVWNPKPSGLCKRHCPVRSCPHNGAQ